MSIKDTDQAERALAYLKQARGDSMPEGVGVEQMQQMLDHLMGDKNGNEVTAEPDFEKVVELMNQLMPPEDPSDPKVRKRKRIVKAATELFVKRGYRKTSMDDIARRAHVAKGTVYLYYKNKPALLMKAIADEKLIYAAKMQELMSADLPDREKLRQWLLLWLLGLGEMPLTARMISGDREVMFAMEEIGENMQADAMALQYQIVARMVDHALAPHHHSQKEIEDRAKVLLGLMYTGPSLIDERVRYGLSIERYAGLLIDMVIDGLTPVKEEAR